MTPQEQIKLENRLCMLERQVKKIIKHLKSQPKTEQNKKDSSGFVCRYCGKRAKTPSPGTCPYSPDGNHVFLKA
ncbi:MAG: hypothetical protein LBR70_06635 [Lactobacillaceae bacterium]|jgi:rubrerythrin|nr:hypothetical protein [Lactobacillaceae bacterium]